MRNRKIYVFGINSETVNDYVIDYVIEIDFLKLIFFSHNFINLDKCRHFCINTCKFDSKTVNESVIFYDFVISLRNRLHNRDLLRNKFFLRNKFVQKNLAPSGFEPARVHFFQKRPKKFFFVSKIFFSRRCPPCLE